MYTNTSLHIDLNINHKEITKRHKHLNTKQYTAEYLTSREKLKKRVKKLLESKDNTRTEWEKIWDTIKATLLRKLTAVNAHFGKTKRPQIN